MGDFLGTRPEFLELNDDSIFKVMDRHKGCERHRRISSFKRVPTRPPCVVSEVLIAGYCDRRIKTSLLSSGPVLGIFVTRGSMLGILYTFWGMGFFIFMYKGSFFSS